MLIIKINTGGSMRIDIDFSELEKMLKGLEEKAKAIDGENQVPFTEIFPNSFMKMYTSFLSIEEMLDKSPFKIETSEDFKSIPDDEWDEFIRSTTQFKSWQEMINKGGEEWVTKKLGLS
jgi:hypothetical protein